jgi:putative ABC transport system permease protein
VIGVARDIRSSQIWQVDDTLLFIPPPAEMTGTVGVFIQPRSDSEASLSAIVHAAKAAGISLKFSDRLATQIEERLLPVRALGWLFGGLGALALLLAAIGLYGVMSFAVNQRVREIGIRVALGATTEKIYALILSQGMRLVAIGITFGVIGGGGLSLLLSKILVGKQDLRGPFDSIGFASVAFILAVVALFACWLPARRATKVDPMTALRAE